MISKNEFVKKVREYFQQNDLQIALEQTETIIVNRSYMAIAGVRLGGTENYRERCTLIVAGS